MAALKGVVKHAGKSVSAPVKTRVFDYLKDLIYNDDDQIRSSSARILGIISEVCVICTYPFSYLPYLLTEFTVFMFSIEVEKSSGRACWVTGRFVYGLK